MDPRSRTYRRVVGGLSVLAMLLSAGPLVAQTQKERMKNLELQLQKVRESLHEAHRELGEKAVRISELEEQLEALSRERPSATSSIHEAEVKRQSELSGAIRRIRELEERLEESEGSRRMAEKKKQEAVREVEVAKGMAKKVSASRPKPDQAFAKRETPEAKREAPEAKKEPEVGRKEKVAAKKKEKVEPPATITIRYESRSASNEAGRERVLAFVQAELEKNARSRFRVEGAADDTPWGTADEDIARNRAQFLVDYLVIQGIPERAFPDVRAHSSKEEPGPGKYVRVTRIHP